MTSNFPYPVDNLREEMALLALTYHFTYDDLLEMYHTERIKWMKLAEQYWENQKKAMNIKAPR